MESNYAQGRGLCEEIAGLARSYLNEPARGGLEGIDRVIGEALGESRWDDAAKWHRVRLRFLRFQKAQLLAASPVAA